MTGIENFANDASKKMESIFDPSNRSGQASLWPARVHAPSSYFDRCMLIFAPFCDQGLGIQALSYVHWLRYLGMRVCVFASQPSKSSGANAPPRMQAHAAEWQVPSDVAVYYSDVSREVQTPAELVAFAQQHGVTDAMMLETAHANVFALSTALHEQLDVRVWAVPNIEMVRRSELKSRYDGSPFAGILCHNEYSMKVIRYLRPTLSSRLRLLPFALVSSNDTLQRCAPFDGRGPIRFLLVGGMNAVSRKRADAVINVFRAIPALHGKATLTVTTQTAEPALRSVPGLVTVISRHLTRSEILAIYGQHHVVIMLSRAEGLGIGLHEAMRAGCAVVTLRHQMYREHVAPTINGWLVPFQEEPEAVTIATVGNDEPVTRSFTFRAMDLAEALKYIVSHPDEVRRRQLGARAAHDAVYTADRISAAWNAALEPPQEPALDL
jgi:glycosyltransferase involved in cell wall biosynthesis